MKILLTYSAPERHLSELEAATRGRAELVQALDLATALREVRTADAFLGNRFLLESIGCADQLQWVQSSSSGVDRLLSEAGERFRGIMLTNCRGVYDEEVADHALALILASVRRLDEASLLRRDARWERRTLQSLGGRQAMILGWGGIGRAIGRRLEACGVSVVPVRRTRREGDEPSVLDQRTWRHQLGMMNLLVLTLPMTSETRHIVGKRELEALLPEALVVNVGRGGTLDENALREVLERGAISGAALDVFEEEPLPAGHWMWTEPRVTMTPHWGRAIEEKDQRWQPLFVENVRRFCSGIPLLNMVDFDAGY